MNRVPGGVLVLAAGKLVLHIATTRLDYHRDELYFIAASKRLAFSYVDFQPVAPFLVRVARILFGDALLGVRLIPALAGALVVVLASLLVRELGGDRRAQILAAAIGLLVPLFVGANSALNTVSLEIPAWMGVALLLARIERTGTQRLWVWTGVAVGIALLVKLTVIAYLGGLVIAIALTPLRRHLRSPWPWIGGLVAVAIVAPSLVWQIHHGLPVVEFASNQSGGGKVLGLSGRLGYVASLLIFPGPVGLVLLVAGARRLLRHRALAIATAAPVLVFLLVVGKGYYASPALAVVLAAGALWPATIGTRARRVLVAALVLNLLVALPLLVPLVPVSMLRNSRDLAQATEMGERLGWKDLSEQVAEVVDDLPAPERDRAIVIGSNYAIPAAIEFHADRYDLPPAVSGHNSAYLWWPRIPDDHVGVTVGFDEATLHRLYADVRRVGTIRNRDGVENYEWGDPLHVVRAPRLPPRELREALKRFTA